MTTWRADQPLYRQLYERILEQVIAGEIAEGQLLPSIREVAASHEINPITVSRAFAQLQSTGLVIKERGIGFRLVSGARLGALENLRKQFLEEEWPGIALKINRLGLTAKSLEGGH